MNAIQYKNLLDHGLTQETIVTLEDIFQTKQDSTVTNKDLDLAILNLQKEIIQVKLELQKEIEVVRKEIQEAKVDVLKAMNNQLWKIVTVLIAVLSPLYGMLIYHIL